jgi:hypothetical protein
MTIADIPVDVKARLIQAAIEVMAEQSFEPDSEQDLTDWLSRNAGQVGQRARDLREALFIKCTGQHRMAREVSHELSKSVYQRIQQAGKSARETR